ncbi:hypothetical protein B7494_g6802, partial [Chlorociboria aeruginascens]
QVQPSTDNIHHNFDYLMAKRQQTVDMSNHLTTPPESSCEASVPPLLTDEASITPRPTAGKKPSLQVQRIIQFLGPRRTIPVPDVLDQKAFHLSSLDELFGALQLNSSLWGYFQDKVSYDYSSRTQQFVVRMHSLLHECCVSNLEFEIRLQLKQYQEDGNRESQAFAKLIQSSASKDLKFPPDDDGHVNVHCPDISFMHWWAKWPGVIIEVAYSQSPKKLDRLAWSYIINSNGGIQVVVGLDLDYSNKRASLIVWRSVITTGVNGIDTLKCVKTIHQEFVDSDGKILAADEKQGLHLQLHDFGLIEPVLSNPHALLEEIFISYRALGEMTILARQNVAENQANARDPVLRPGTIKEARPLSPGADITADDEGIWEAREAWDDEESNERDPDYTE